MKKSEDRLSGANIISPGLLQVAGRTDTNALFLREAMEVRMLKYRSPAHVGQDNTGQEKDKGARPCKRTPVL